MLPQRICVARLLRFLLPGIILLPPGVWFNFQNTFIFFLTQTCSMEVNCETLAVMGATLANGGECPITNEPVISPSNVRDVLSLMHRCNCYQIGHDWNMCSNSDLFSSYSCGMYNYSGQFAFNVSKSDIFGWHLANIFAWVKKFLGYQISFWSQI